MRKPFLFRRGKYYHLQFQPDGQNKPKRISTGCIKKNDALKFLVEYKSKLESESVITDQTWENFRKDYLEYIKQSHSYAYYIDIRTTFNQFNIYAKDSISLKQITPQMIEKFISDTSLRSKHQAKKNYVNLKCAFGKAVVWNYLKFNPLRNIKPPKVPSNNPIFINEDELKKIIRKEPSELLRDIYFFAFHTGMRLGEIVNLKWDQVSLSERVIRVQNTKNFTTKGKKERLIPINEKLYLKLQRRVPKIIKISNSDFVFNKNGFKFNPDYISKNFKAAVRKVKSVNQEFHFHGLRHSFASNLVQKGVSLFVVKELLGHQDLRTTQIYSHLTISSLREAVKALEN